MDEIRWNNFNMAIWLCMVQRLASRRMFTKTCALNSTVSLPANPNEITFPYGNKILYFTEKKNLPPTSDWEPFKNEKSNVWDSQNRFLRLVSKRFRSPKSISPINRFVRLFYAALVLSGIYSVLIISEVLTTIAEPCNNATRAKFVLWHEQDHIFMSFAIYAKPVAAERFELIAFILLQESSMLLHDVI